MIHELIYAAYYASLIRAYLRDNHGTPPESFVIFAADEAKKVATQYSAVIGDRDISI